MKIKEEDERRTKEHVNMENTTNLILFIVRFTIETSLLSFSDKNYRK